MVLEKVKSLFTAARKKLGLSTQTEETQRLKEDVEWLADTAEDQGKENESLITAVRLMHEKLQEETAAATEYISQLVIAAGGSVTLSKDLIDSVKNNELSLEFKNNDDGSQTITVSIVEAEVQESEADTTLACDDQCDCK
jgi:hypothetical protein